MSGTKRPPPVLLGRAGALHLHVWPGEGPATLILFGPGRQRVSGPASWWGQSFAAKLGWTTLAFSSDAMDWYPAEDMAALLPVARKAAGPVRVTYGYSMGGYAALKYGRALGARATLALSPQYSIDPADMPAEARARHFFDSRRHTGMAVRADDLAAPAFLVFDPLIPMDGAHAAQLMRLPGLHGLAMRFAGHSTPIALIEAGALPGLLEAALGGDVPAARALVRAARRASPSLLSAMAITVEGRGHRRWAAALEAAAAAGRGPLDGGYEARTRALRRNGRFHEEEALLRAWIAERPHELEPRLRLAWCCLAMKDPARAVLAIRDAMANGQVDLRLHAELIRCLRRLDRRQEAIEAAEAAVAQEPDLASTHAQLGDVLLWAGMPDRARAVFERAHAMDPANARARKGLALLLPMREGHGEAGPHLRWLMERMVGEQAKEAAWHDLARQAEAAGNLPVAMALVQRALVVHAASVPLRVRLGRLCLDAGKPAAAEAAFRAAARLAPGSRPAWLGRMEALWRLQRFAEGQRAAAVAAGRMRGQAVLAARHAAFILRAGGDAQAAEREARRAVALNPDEACGHIALTDALWRRGRGEAALLAIEAAAGRLPGHAAIAAMHGEVLLSRGEAARSAAAYERAVALPDAPPHAWLGLIEALLRAGRRADARDAARKAVAAHPACTEMADAEAELDRGADPRAGAARIRDLARRMRLAEDAFGFVPQDRDLPGRWHPMALAERLGCLSLLDRASAVWSRRRKGWPAPGWRAAGA